MTPPSTPPAPGSPRVRPITAPIVTPTAMNSRITNSGPQSPTNARSSQPAVYPPVGSHFSLAPTKNESTSASTKLGSASRPKAVVFTAPSARVPAR